METSKGVIIADTSGLISLFFPSDHNHEVAVQAAKRLSNDHKDILIPAAVFVEFLNILGRIAGHEAALAAVSELQPPFIILSEQSNNPQALQKFEVLPPSVSFTDCLVMAVADEYATPDIGFQIVSEKFYTVDDCNPHRTKCNKMIIVWHLADSSHGKSRRYMWR